MSASTTRTVRALIDAASHSLRRDAVFAVVAAASALVPLVLLVGWILGGFPQPSLFPLLLDAVLLVTAVTVAVRARRRIARTLDETAVARAAEAHFSMPAGALRGAIELDRALPAGASRALAQRSERELASKMSTVPSREITGPLGMQWRRHRARALVTFAGLVMAVFVVGFATPTRSRAAWSPLLHPVRNLKAPPMSALAVKPGNASVPRGGGIDVRIRAHDRAAVTLHWRVQGDIAHEQLLPVLADTAAYALSHLDGVTDYWVEAPDGAISPHYTLTPVDPLLLADLSVEITYPSYLNRPPERYDGEVPALEIPQGTEIVLRGHATRALDSASLRADSANGIALHVDEAAFSGRWVPATSGIYEWHMRDSGQNELAVQPTPIAVTIIRDAAPSVVITFPARDTVFGAELQLPVAAEAQDDHGVSAASLITWRVSRTGAKDPPAETPLALGGNENELLQAVLDASSRNLTSGDTLKYFIRVRDNSPMGQTGDSRTYAVALPGMADLRDAATSQTDALMNANAEIAKTAAKLQEETRNTQRRTTASNATRAATGQGGSPEESRMQFSESQGAQKVLDQQQQLMKNMDEMRAKVDALQKSLENAGLQDADMQKKLDDLRKLYDEAMTPEMRQKMDALKKAIDKLDPNDVEKALKDLVAQQEQMKQQLERSMQLMQRAASEQELNRLSQETKELARQQDALASATNEQKDPNPAAQQDATKQQQTDVAKKTDDVAKQLAGLKDELEKRGEQRAAQGASKATDSVNAAKQSMQQASNKSSQGKQNEAATDAKQATQQLNDAARQLDDARKDMVDAWKDETQQSMHQATRDALALAQKQQALKDQMDKQGSSIPKPALPQPQVGKPQDKSGQQPPGASAQQGSKPQNGDKGSKGGAGGKGQTGQKEGGRSGAASETGTPQAGQQNDLNALRSEQSALQQGLQQLSQNLQQTGDKSAQVNRDVGSSLSKANQSMQQTMDALQNATPDSQMPSDQAGQSVDALNKLALSLLKNSQEVEQSQSGTGAQQMMQQLSDIAKQQGSLNGQGSSLVPMNIGPSAMSEQVKKLGQSQEQIAQQLGDINKTSKDQALGSVDELAKEAAAIAQEMQSGHLEPQTMARQEKLFHRLLDAGRSLQKDEVSNERVAERPGATTLSQPAALDPKLFKDGTRFRAPTPEELRAMPPAYRKIILDYFERLNHPDKQH